LDQKQRDCRTKTELNKTENGNGSKLGTSRHIKRGNGNIIKRGKQK